jgi:YD repeat-containing protein
MPAFAKRHDSGAAFIEIPQIEPDTSQSNRSSRQKRKSGCQAEVYLLGVFYFCATDSVGRDVDKFRPETPRLRPLEAAPSPRLSGTSSCGPLFHFEGQTRRKRATRSEPEIIPLLRELGSGGIFKYDSMGDQKSVTDSLGFTSTNYTDDLGRVLSAADPLGNITSFEYDALNRLQQVADEDGNGTAYNYTQGGNLQNITDRRGSVTGFSYDNRNRFSALTDPLQRVESYTYDALDNVTSTIDDRGKVTVYQYDALNRLVFVGYGANGGAYESTVSYTYDGANRLAQAVDSIAGTITRTYDANDDLTSETTPQGTISYTYDNIGRRTSMTVTGQPTVNYSYDENGRVTSISQQSSPSPSIVTIAYDAGGRPPSVTLPNGIVVSYSYDGSSRLSGITWTLGANQVGNLAYTYDADDRIIEKTGTLAATNLPSLVTGNVFDAANEATIFNGAQLTYDNNGNLIGDGTNSYTWDARNHLVAIGGAISASFVYDAFGRRVSKTVNGSTTDYLYDSANPVQELAPKGGNWYLPPTC